MHMTMIAAALLAASTAAQATQTLRGKVEDVQGTANQFFLDCTSIPLTSAALNLNLHIGQQFVMEVINTGTSQNPSLEVVTVTATAKSFDMGNLRLGKSATWEAFSNPGEFAMMFAGQTANTGYMPFGSAGVWLIGSDTMTIHSGFTNQLGALQVSVTMPNVPSLIGTSYTAQALISNSGTWFFSNPDCKTVEQ